jgi:hypothetical protein
VWSGSSCRTVAPPPPPAPGPTAPSNELSAVEFVFLTALLCALLLLIVLKLCPQRLDRVCCCSQKADNKCCARNPCCARKLCPRVSGRQLVIGVFLLCVVFTEMVWHNFTFYVACALALCGLSFAAHQCRAKAQELTQNAIQLRQGLRTTNYAPQRSASKQQFSSGDRPGSAPAIGRSCTKPRR